MEVYGADICGIDGQLIRFSTVKEEKRPGVKLLGLAGKVVKEALDRAQHAIDALDGNWSVLKNSGYTINLSPAEMQKQSSGLALPLAIMLLQANVLQNLDTLTSKIKEWEEKLQKQIDKGNQEKKRQQFLDAIDALEQERRLVIKYRKRLSENKSKYLLIGSLDIVSGRLETPEHGMFGMMSAAKKGFKLIVPEDSETHAALVAKGRGVRAYVANDLQEAWDIVLGQKPREARYRKSLVKQKRLTRYVPNLNAVNGLSRPKEAMTVALAGGHNILLVGPPGQGKSMLASAATGLLPDLSPDQMFEVNKIYSAKGRLHENEVVLTRPFQEAHATINQAGLFGGGYPHPRPGVVSLAHRGVLLFDEINLASGAIIERLRGPLSNRLIEIQRANATIKYPCNFVFVAAMNPCKCGWYHHYQCPVCNDMFYSLGDVCAKHPRTRLVGKCRCTPSEVRKYKKKISGPLLQRIALKVLVSKCDNSRRVYGYASSTVRTQIQEAREAQKRRYKKSTLFRCNADIPDRSQFEELDGDTARYYRKRCRELDSPRMEVKILLVARTIADLAGVRTVRPEHLERAIDLMGLTNEYFADF